MSKIHLEYLYQLVHSMGQAEKRSFKLFSQRSFSSKKALNFVYLFDVLNKMKVFNEKLCRKELSMFSPKQISDLKFNLNYHILQSLRIIYSKNEEFKIREMIDFAQILYKKGLFSNCLDQLQKTKERASKTHHLSLQLEVVEFEKKLESRHVTRSHPERAKELTGEIEFLREVSQWESQWSDLSLSLYDVYLKEGHVKTKEEHHSLETFFKSKKPSIPSGKYSTAVGDFYKHRSYVWFYYITQEFELAYRHSLLWINVLKEARVSFTFDIGGLIKAYHNCLSILFYCLDEKRHNQKLAEMHAIILSNEKELDPNTKLMSFIYLETAKLNAVFLSCKFEESVPYVEELGKKLNRIQLLDSHRLFVFWYKIASIYFCMGDFKNAIKFLNQIINSNVKALREDVQCFARILSLVSHFELNNDDLLFYQVKSTYRFLKKMKNTQLVQQEIVAFLRNALYKGKLEVKSMFPELLERFALIRQNKYERKPFLYLDIQSWLESKISERSVSEIIRERISQR